MNLAQIIDPERAERMKAECAAPGKALRVVKHSTLDEDDQAHKERSLPKVERAAAPLPKPAAAKRFGRVPVLQGRILSALAGSEAGLSSRDVANALHADINMVCAVLSALQGNAHVRRSGSRRGYRYAISASGRRHLAQIKTRVETL